MDTTPVITNVPKNKPKKVDPVGLSVYGESFIGYDKIGQVNDLIAAFKELYYERMIEDSKTTIKSILSQFNVEICYPNNRTFHPYMNQLKIWRRKWDLDLMEKMADKSLVILDEKKHIHQIIKTRDEENMQVLGGASDEHLEAGVRTLGGELLNDAMQMLRDDQALEEIYDNDELIKRRTYIVNVFAHATKLVHGKAALMLKASEEKRNNAGFLMDLLARASAGKITDEEMDLLKTSYDRNPQPVSA